MLTEMIEADRKGAEMSSDSSATEATLPEAMPEQGRIADVTVLFTDLKGSSALYRRVGDAAAYRLIRWHFDLLAAVITDSSGTLVKTIGDAVMAAFPSPQSAVKAALAIQSRIRALTEACPADHRLTIKLGVHAGPVIAVRLHDRDDYFGEVVNMAAQLRDLSCDGELVISQTVAEDPLVSPLLSGYGLVRERIALKGSAIAQPVARISRCWRISTPAGVDRP